MNSATLIKPNSRCFVLAAVLHLSLCQFSDGQTIIIMRHAQKSLEGDSRLTDEGHYRARKTGELLASLFPGKSFNHIYYSRGDDNDPVEGRPSRWLRVCQTAHDVATGLNDARAGSTPEPERMPMFDDPKKWRDWLNNLKPTDLVVLVVHHEDIPTVRMALAPKDPSDGDDINDYEHLFVATCDQATGVFSVDGHQKIPRAPATGVSPTTRPTAGCLP